jgi:aminoglycoside phosphotransferase (APT) family kinase protein
MHIDLNKYAWFTDKTIESLKLLPKQGFSNKNYMFKDHNNTYLLRKFILEDRDRELEYNIQFLAYEKGIAAKPLVLDLDNDLMICEFLEGEHRNRLSKEDLLKLVQVLKKLHAIKIDSELIELKSLFTSKTNELEEAFIVLNTYPKEMLLCHNDLNPKNIIFSRNNLKFIDWEFAGINDLYFDLAAVSVEFLFDDELEAYFLEEYFETAPWHKAKLEAYKTIYIALCKQWFEGLTPTQP